MQKGHFIASVNCFVGNFRDKVPIECYIRLFQSYCSTHYGSIIWPLHDRGFNDFCVTWNKGIRRMLNISNMTHTALLGQLIMLTSRNAIVRHFVRRAIYSAQSPIGRNMAVIRHRYAIHVIDINVKHVHRHYPFSHPQLSGTVWLYWNYCHTCQPKEKFSRDKQEATEGSEPASEGGSRVLPGNFQ